MRCIAVVLQLSAMLMLPLDPAFAGSGAVIGTASWAVDSWYDNAYNKEKGGSNGSLESHTICKGVRSKQFRASKKNSEEKVQAEKASTDSLFHKGVSECDNTHERRIQKKKGPSTYDGGFSRTESDSSEPQKRKSFRQQNFKSGALHAAGKHYSCGKGSRNNRKSQVRKSPDGKANKQAGDSNKVHGRNSKGNSEEVRSLPASDIKNQGSQGVVFGIASFYDSNSVKKEGTCHEEKCFTASGREIHELEREGVDFCAVPRNRKLRATFKVTNLGNGKTVTVVALDRGGFERHGRVIDLSKQSFSKIADPRSGLCRVKVEPIE